MNHRDAILEQLSPAFRSEAAQWFMGRLFSLPRMAHHPHCRCFDNHVLRLGPLVLCLGCTCVACGAFGTVFGVLWLCAEKWSLVEGLGTSGFVAFGVALFAPTLIQPFFQWKPFKMIARGALGASIVLLWFGAIALLPMSITGFALRFVFVVIFAMVFRATQWQRMRYASNPCSRCEGMVYPFCSDNRSRLGPLIAELERKARPEDAPFVAFARAIAGDSADGTSIEIAAIRDCVAAPSSPGGCAHWSPGRHG
jgi:hypothetical protein